MILTASYTGHTKGAGARFTLFADGEQVREFPLEQGAGYGGKMRTFAEMVEYVRETYGRELNLFSCGGFGSKQTWSSVEPTKAAPKVAAPAITEPIPEGVAARAGAEPIVPASGREASSDTVVFDKKDRKLRIAKKAPKNHPTASERA